MGEKGLYNRVSLKTRMLNLRFCFAVTTVVGFVTVGLGQTGREYHGKLGYWYKSTKNVAIPDDDDLIPQMERRGDPPAQLPFKPSKLPLLTPPVFGNYKSVQVNVNALGKNIVGDAANEPSMAMDPLNPNRIVVGWRQFDNVTSNFRQAGNAYTTDGGKTWHNNVVLTKGTFRSDPVINSDSKGNFYYNSLLETFYTTVFKSPTGALWTTLGPAMGGDKQWMTMDTTTGPGNGNMYEAWSTAADNYNGNQFSRSTDGGKTWLTPVGIPNQPIWGTLDVAPDGDVFLCGIGNNGFQFSRSSTAQYKDQTVTFDINTIVDLGGSIVFGDSINADGLMGQTWIGTDKSKGRYKGNIYMLCSVGVDASDPCDVHFARSTDGGQTFQPWVRINDDPLGQGASHWFGTLSVASNGRIDACWYDNRANPAEPVSALYYSCSYDGGQTWTPNQQLSPTFDPTIGYPNQNKLGDYIGMIAQPTYSDIVYSATFNGEEDIWFLNAPVTARLPIQAFDVSTALGTYVSGNAASLNAEDGNAYEVNSVPVKGSGQEAQVQVDYVLPTSSPVALTIQIGAKAVPKATGTLLIYNWVTKQYVSCKNLVFDASGQISLTVPVSSILANYISAANEFRVQVRTELPASVKPNNVYTFKVDQLSLLFG